MDVQQEFTQFLILHRNRLSPGQAGISPGRGRRRVPGLRREEVAVLAGVSVEYYTRLEQGTARGASSAVLDGVAEALQMDTTERAHLFDLAQALGPAARRARPAPQPPIRPNLTALLDALTGAAAIVLNERGDALGANTLGRALYREMFRRPGAANMPRFVFLHASARTFYQDWDDVADTVVSQVRTGAGRNPFDRGFADLIDELSTHSDEFRTLWAQHRVRPMTTGLKRLRHPEIGDLELAYEYLRVPADEGLMILTYVAGPGTSGRASFRLLESLATRRVTQGPDDDRASTPHRPVTCRDAE